MLCSHKSSGLSTISGESHSYRGGVDVDVDRVVVVTCGCGFTSKILPRSEVTTQRCILPESSQARGPCGTSTSSTLGL